MIRFVSSFCPSRVLTHFLIAKVSQNHFFLPGSFFLQMYARKTALLQRQSADTRRVSRTTSAFDSETSVIPELMSQSARCGCVLSVVIQIQELKRSVQQCSSVEKDRAVATFISSAALSSPLHYKCIWSRNSNSVDVERKYLSLSFLVKRGRTVSAATRSNLSVTALSPPGHLKAERVELGRLDLFSFTC